MIIVMKYTGGLFKKALEHVKYWLEVEYIALYTKKWGRTPFKSLLLVFKY